MITKPYSTMSLEDVLNELASLPHAPDASALKAFVARYPAFQAEIVRFVTDWIEMEATEGPDEVASTHVQSVVNRAMSHAMQVLYDAKQPKEIQQLTKEIVAAGHSLESFERAVGIDRTILTCLDQRLIRPPTMPRALLVAAANALSRAIEPLYLYVRLPPIQASAHKAKKQPTFQQMDFAAIVDMATLSDADKARWKAQPPDPALRE